MKFHIINASKPHKHYVFAALCVPESVVFKIRNTGIAELAVSFYNISIPLRNYGRSVMNTYFFTIQDDFIKN